jgi:hypothetical protein
MLSTEITFSGLLDSAIFLPNVTSRTVALENFLPAAKIFVFVDDGEIVVRLDDTHLYPRFCNGPGSPQQIRYRSVVQ